MNDRNNLLYEAVDRGDLATVNKLLQEGADPKSTNVSWWYDTPLHMAAGGGHVEIVDALIKHNADPNIKGKNEITPLNSGIGHIKVVKYLLSYPEVRKNITANNYRALRVAAAAGYLD